MPQQKALDAVAAQSTQYSQLLFGLHALGCSGHLQAMCQSDNRVYKWLRAGTLTDALNKTLVYFQIVDWQTLQIAERGVSRAKVVD